MFTFCPLQGALSDSTASQSLLELDGGVKVLIDVGWDETFDVDKLKELEKQVPTISLILLTHATVSHIAAYAHCCKNFPQFTRIPVYATRPVIDLGRTLTQDLYASSPAAATAIDHDQLAETLYAYTQTVSRDSNFLRQAPTAEEIAKYFSLIQPLKYSQPHQPLPSPFSPPLNGLTVTAYNAGHTLGGTIWHIQHGLESIVYAVDWNQARENVFAGAAWLGGGHGGAQVIEQLRKPTALVCSSRMPTTLPRAKRDEQFLDNIRACVAKGGTVLIPVDSSARVLELSYLMEHAWRTEAAQGSGASKPLNDAHLYLFARNISSTLRHARSMFEWMDENIVREFEAVADSMRNVNPDNKKGKGAGPFDFKHVKLLEKKAQVDRLLLRSREENWTKGMVILASDRSLEWGFSKDVLKQIAQDAKNLVILTEKPSLSSQDAPSISRKLWEWWQERRDGVAVEQLENGESLEQVHSGGREIEIAEATKQPLAGDEVAIYQQWLATQRQLQATLPTGSGAALEGVDVVDDASSESSTDSDVSGNEQQGRALNISTTMAQANRKKVVLKDEDLGINVLVKKKGVHDFDVRDKKGRERIFPVPIRKRRNDDFGDIIRPEEFLKAEEREDVGQEPSALKHEHDEGLGKKRKWGDIGKKTNASNKRTQLNKNVDDDMAMSNPSDASQVDGDEEDVEDEDEEEPSMGPSKLVITKANITVNLRIAFVDFSGLHDKRSVEMLIPLIAPRKLILVSGNEEETMALADDCKKLLGATATEEGSSATTDVYTPAVGVSIDASVDTNAWVVKLADPLVRRLKWQNVRGLSVVALTARLLGTEGDADTHPHLPSNPAEEESASKRLKTEVETTADDDSKDTAVATIVPTLDVLPTTMASATRSVAQPLHVGDLRLADLRRAMQTSGHTAEFRGEGTLLVDGSVAVRKTAAGRIEVESIGLPAMGTGAVTGGTFWAVRRMIYDGLAVVAGA
ncbi:hypothetical protein N0V82_009842 [Gnomoniopsis sp. IMI 355080]|nr:hypothetical protein N0V82_009842 [Gnomoniopsis sp. IMI 355080]